MLNLKQYSLAAHVGAIIVAIAVQAVAFVVFWRAYIALLFDYPGRIVVHPLAALVAVYVTLVVGCCLVSRAIRTLNMVGLLSFYLAVFFAVVLLYIVIAILLGVEWPMSLITY